MTQMTAAIIRAIDLPLGWLLILPRDIALLLFSTGTALMMTLVRRAVTNQDLLRRCADDLRRLGQLRKAAGKTRDKAALGRLRATVGQIKTIQLAADMRVLAAVLIPVALLAVWANERFDYLPLRRGENVVVRGTYIASSINEVTHLLPSPMFELKSPSIRIIRPNARTPQGIAEWIIQPNQDGNAVITIRHKGETATHPLKIGRGTYQTMVLHHPADRLNSTAFLLDQYLPVGSPLGSQWLGLPPWMIGYLVLTVCLTPAIKRLLAVR